MSPENQTKEVALDTKKRKIKLALVIIMGLILVWQVMGLFSTPSVPAAPAMAQNRPPMTTKPPGAAQQHPAMAAAGGVPAPAPAAPADTAPKQTALQMDADLLQLQKETQKTYISGLNELEMLKLKIQIAKANQDLTAAKFEAISEEQKIANLLTVAAPAPSAAPAAAGPPPQLTENVPVHEPPQKPVIKSPIPPPPVTIAPPTPPTPPTPAPVTTATTTTTTVVETPLPPKELPYMVMSVSYKNNQWHTVIGYEDKLYNVSVGDNLPADESLVVGINKDGVVLKTKEGKRRMIQMTSSL